MTTTITDTFTTPKPALLVQRFKAALFFPKKRSPMLFLFWLLSLTQAHAASSVEQLKQAISLRKNSQYQQALELLAPLKNQFGDHKRINIELALNHISLKNFHQAKSIAGHIAGLPLSQKERKTLASLNQLIEENEQKQQTAHQFSTRFSAYASTETFTSRFPLDYYIEVSDPAGFSPADTGAFPGTDGYYYTEVFYDDAYPGNAYPEQEISYQQERITAREKKQSSYRAQQLKLKHHYRHGKKLSFFSTPWLFSWRNHLSLYQKQGQQKGQENQVIAQKQKLNYRRLKLDTGFSLLNDKLWLLDLGFSRRYHYYDSEHLLNEDKLRLSASLPLLGNRLTLALAKENKTYRGLYNIHNTRHRSARIEYSLDIGPTNTWHLGSRFLQNNAWDSYNSYDELTLYSRLNYTFSRGPLLGLTGFVTLNYHRLMYEIRDPSLVNWGREYKQSIAAGVQYPLTANLSLGLNGHLSRNNKNQQSGKDDWQRLEAFISYRF